MAKNGQQQIDPDSPYPVPIKEWFAGEDGENIDYLDAPDLRAIAEVAAKSFQQLPLPMEESIGREGRE